MIITYSKIKITLIMLFFTFVGYSQNNIEFTLKQNDTCKSLNLLINNDLLIIKNKHWLMGQFKCIKAEILRLKSGPTWLSIPRHLRTASSELTPTPDVFAQDNMSVPYSALIIDYNSLNKSMPASHKNIVNAQYQSLSWVYETSVMENIDSRRGYVLHDIDPIHERLIKLEGTQENPASYIELYCKKENWIGYYLEEEQNVFDALADIEPDIYHIQLQYTNCYRYNYYVSNQCGGTKSTVDYAPGTWICNGKPTIKYGDMVKVTPVGDILDFQWNYSGNPPSGAIRPPVVYYQFVEKPSYETFVLVLDSTTTNPTEIGAFVNDTCIGACSVTTEDSVVVLSAYTDIAPGDSIIFEQHFGSQKNSNIRLNSYLVKNNKNNVFENRIVKTGEKQEAFIINFNTKDLDSENIDLGGDLRLYPNPLTDKLNYSFKLQKESNIKMTLFDINGRQIGVVLNEKFNKGYATGSININNFFSNKILKGIYIINIVIDNNTYNKKLIIN